MSLQATFTSVIEGNLGNAVTIYVVYDEGGADLVINILNDTGIELIVGTTGGTQNLQWDDLATIFNADPDASALAVMVGEPTKVVPSGLTAAPSDGSDGQGLSQFYFVNNTTPKGATCPTGVGTVLTPYDSTVGTSGGTPTHFELTGGSLPPGLELDEDTGEITGIPTMGGDFTQEYTVTFDDDSTVTIECGIGIAAPSPSRICVAQA